MTVGFVLPFVLVFGLLVLFASTLFYRPRYYDIDEVILLLRKLDASALQMLLDPGEEWSLQQLLGSQSFRIEQEARIRLLREYLRRVAHNVEVIQLWVAGEYEFIKDKDRATYTEKDCLVAEALQVALELRIYSLAARIKLWFWSVLPVYRLPQRLTPRLADLRMQCGVNVLAKYRRLTEVADTLSLGCGKAYRDRLLQVL